MEMIIRSFPLFCILMCLSFGVISSVLKGRAARALSIVLITLLGVMNLTLVFYTLKLGDSYVFMMGHFPAPWGNEIRVGVLEAVMATFFCIIMMLSVLGGQYFLKKDIAEPKSNLFYTLVDLLMSSLLALVYTNDLFTAYVFIEINTIAACGLIMIRNTGHSLVAATRYMIMSLLGSGLVLIGISLLYDITGHLLMSDIKETVAEIVEHGEYTEPLIIIVALISVGLAIKSALYPFHAWLPDAYGMSTTSASAILSSLVSKAYIFLLIKICVRVIGWDIINRTGINNIFYAFGLLGMIMGSVHAIQQKNIKRMIAYSSVAQIGYIYMGLGIGNTAGIIASMFHIFMHASSKSMLFVAEAGLAESSGNDGTLEGLKGAGYRNKTAGVAFTVGAFSMIGVPLFAGFISKICFAGAAIDASVPKLVITLVVLAISTILNAVYFMRAVIKIYTPDNENTCRFKSDMFFKAAAVGFIVLNVCLNCFAQKVLNLLNTGLSMFS